MTADHPAISLDEATEAFVEAKKHREADPLTFERAAARLRELRRVARENPDPTQPVAMTVAVSSG